MLIHTSLDTALKTYSMQILRAPRPSRVHFRLFESSFGVPRPLASLVHLVCVCMFLNEFVVRCFVMEFLFLFYFGIMYEYVSRFALVYMFICCGFFCCSVFRLGLGGFSCVLLWCYRLRWGGSLSFKYNQPVHGL